MWLCLLLAFLLCLGIQELLKKSQQKEKQNIPRIIGFKIQVQPLNVKSWKVTLSKNMQDLVESICKMTIYHPCCVTLGKSFKLTMTQSLHL